MQPRFKKLFLKRRVVAAGVATITWNSADKHADVTLSGGDLIATRSATASPAFRNARATGSGRTTGKYYYEVTLTARSAAGTFGIGIADSLSALDSYSGTRSRMWFDDGGTFADAGGAGAIQTAAVGNTMCFAYDLTNLKWWARTNGGNWNNDVIANQDPANNIGGKTIAASQTWWPIISIYTSTDNGTANFGGSAFAQTPPTGFGNP